MKLAMQELQKENSSLGTISTQLTTLRQLDGQAITSSRQAKELHCHLRDMERACAYCTIFRGRQP